MGLSLFLGLLPRGLRLMLSVAATVGKYWVKSTKDALRKWLQNILAASKNDCSSWQFGHGHHRRRYLSASLLLAPGAPTVQLLELGTFSAVPAAAGHILLTLLSHYSSFAHKASFLQLSSLKTC